MSENALSVAVGALLRDFGTEVFGEPRRLRAALPDLLGDNLTAFRGEIDALVPERVWQEISRGLQTPHPARMAQVLVECGAWSRLWSELPEQGSERLHAWAVLEQWPQADLAQRWALWCQGCSAKQMQSINQRLRTPTEVAELSEAWAAFQTELLTPWVDATHACQLLHRLDAQRRPQRVTSLLDLAAHWAHTDQTRSAAQLWLRALQALQSVDIKALHQQAMDKGLRGPAIGQAVMQAQAQAIAAIT